jgi:hypothetical protein
VLQIGVAGLAAQRGRQASVKSGGQRRGQLIVCPELDLFDLVVRSLQRALVKLAAVEDEETAGLTRLGCLLP